MGLKYLLINSYKKRCSKYKISKKIRINKNWRSFAINFLKWIKKIRSIKKKKILKVIKKNKRKLNFFKFNFIMISQKKYPYFKYCFFLNSYITFTFFLYLILLVNLILFLNWYFFIFKIIYMKDNNNISIFLKTNNSIKCKDISKNLFMAYE